MIEYLQLQFLVTVTSHSVSVLKIFSDRIKHLLVYYKFSNFINFIVLFENQFSALFTLGSKSSCPNIPN